MKHIQPLLLVLLTTLTLTAQLPTGDPTKAGFSPKRLARLDSYFQNLVDQGTLPNAQTLILRHGKVIHRGTYGYSDLENRTPARPDDIYRIASQTKALVTVGIMMEYEKGKLLLEDPVSKYIPSFANLATVKDYDESTDTYFMEGTSHDITIRELLTHTSGIAYGIEQDERDGGPDIPFFASLENETTAEVVDRIALRPLAHHPGEDFTYGLGIDVAGRVLEVISGQDLDDYLHDNIWALLGMADSYFYLPKGKHDRLVKLYSKAQPDDPLTLHENETTAEVVDRIALRPLAHHPGEDFTYGLSIDVAGRVLEVVSGQELDDYLRDNIWQPLGMADSYFYLPKTKHDRLVKLYSKAQPDNPLTLHENETYRNFPVSGAQTYFSGGAGSVGTIDDYARFCQMLLNRGELNGVRLLAPKTVDYMTRNQIGDLEVWDRQDGFGFGFQVGSENSRYLDMATPGSYTWGGMYLSEYTIDPVEDLVMLFYTNVHPISQYSEICRKFRILVYQALVDE